MRASRIQTFFLWIGLAAMGCSDNSSVTFTESEEDVQGDISEGSDAVESTDGEDEDGGTDVTDESCSSKEECSGDAGPCETFACVEGACVLQSVEAGSACEDGDLCTEGTTCDEAGACVGGTVVEAVSSPCETCACDPEAGLQCFPSAVGTPCSDEDCCTLDDVCGECDPEVDENCSSSGRQCVPGEAKDCDDANGCTVDQCTCGAEDEAVCEWNNVADNLPCDFSENDCTVGDYCSAGVCIVGTPAPLDDENPCTEDSCVKGEITHAPLLSGQCDDGNECTTGDSCKLGTCVGGDPVTCVIPDCASDSVCIQGEGCVVQEISWMPEGAACDDGNSCTDEDQCTGDGNCEGQANSCDDFNPCTTDQCDAEGGCTNEPNPEMEGKVCAEVTSDCGSESVCVSGACMAESGNDDSCDDGNECTTDACVDGQGCVYTAKTDGSPCDDGNPCTEDECSQGACVSTDLGGSAGGETVTCNQSNPLDPEGTCCCFADDPTGDYTSGHVLDMGFQTSGTALECCIAPGLTSGCSDTAYISVSETGAVWDLVTSFSTNSVKKPEGGWESICVTIEPGVDYQYVRGANDSCYVDFFSCTPSCGDSCEPVNGGWSAPVFGACSEPCGGGTKTGISTCTSPAPECGGASCTGSGVTTESCNTQACEEALVIGKNIFDEGESLHDLVIPVGVGSMTVSAWGAGGGGGYPGVGGGGAYVTAIFQVIPGDQLTVMVAGGGAKPGGGGGASLVLLNGADKVIAGGGGGAGSDGSSGNTTPALASSGGGAAGVGGTAQAGSAYTKYDIVLTGGQGGGPAAGGAGGTIVDNSIYSQCTSDGIAGKAYAGGAGAHGTNCTPGNPASFQFGGQASVNGGSGGGGSGYYGGGSGAQKDTYVGSGGGGGSSYLAVDTLTSSSEGASGNMPGGMSSLEYQGIVGQGGKDGLGSSQPGPGQDGLVIIELNP